MPVALSYLKLTLELTGKNQMPPPLGANTGGGQLCIIKWQGRANYMQLPAACFKDTVPVSGKNSQRMITLKCIIFPMHHPKRMAV